MSALVICLYIAAGLEVLSGLSYIPLVGKTRTYTGGPVVVMVVLTAFVVVVLVLAAMRL